LQEPPGLARSQVPDETSSTFGLRLEARDGCLHLGLRKPFALEPGLDPGIAPASLGQSVCSAAREPRIVHEPGVGKRRDDSRLRVGTDAAVSQALPKPALGERPRTQGTHGCPEGSLAPELTGDGARQRPVEREVGTQPASSSGVPRLGEYFVRRGIMSSEQVARAAERQAALQRDGTRLPFGQVAYDMGFISRSQLDTALSEQRSDFNDRFY